MPAGYVVNAHIVAAERFGDELVIIQFDSGKYYSLGGSAVPAWEALENPATVAGLAAALSAGAGASSPGIDAVTQDVESLLAQFVAERLVIEAEADDAVPALAAFDYAPAKIETYADLADLVAIDPVHDVDAMMGWPRVAST